MPYVVPVVSFSPTYNGTFTTLAGIQSVHVTRGRKFFQDNFAASSCTIDLIPQDSGGVAAAMPAVGQWVEVRANTGGVGNAYFNGRVTDVSRTYGMPFNSSTLAAPADTVTISAVGPTGMLGTSNGPTFSVGASTRIDPIITYVCSLVNFDAAQLGSNTDTFTYAGSYSNYQVFDLINQLARSAQILIDDYDSTRSVSPRILKITNQSTLASPVFTDDGSTGADIYKFDEIQYLSSAQSTFTQVSVETPGLAAQVTQTGLGPYVTLNYSTYNETTDAALGLSQYLLDLSNQTTPVPFNVSASTFSAPDVMKVAELYSFGRVACAMGTQVTVEFRGATAYGQLQGITSSFYQDHGRVSLALSPSLGAPFTLDSPGFGILGGTGITYNTAMDYNELGYIYNDNYADNGNRLGF